MTRTSLFFAGILYALIIGSILSGCTDPNAWKKIDVSRENVNYTVQRFDQDFFAINTFTSVNSPACWWQSRCNIEKLTHGGE